MFLVELYLLIYERKTKIIKLKKNILYVNFGQTKYLPKCKQVNY